MIRMHRLISTVRKATDQSAYSSSWTNIFSTRICARAHARTYIQEWVSYHRCSNDKMLAFSSEPSLLARRWLREGFIHDLSPTASCTCVLSRQDIRPLQLWMRRLICTVRKETDHAAYSSFLIDIFLTHAHTLARARTHECTHTSLQIMIFIYLGCSKD